MTKELAQFILARPHGFVTEADLPELLRLDPFAQLLVRCGRCRFTTSAQDLETITGMVVAGGDCVRDVSFTSVACWEAHAIIEGRKIICAAIDQAMERTAAQLCELAGQNYDDEPSPKRP